MKAKGSNCLWQTECSWFMTTQILTNGTMLVPKVIQQLMHQGVWMWQIERGSRGWYNCPDFLWQLDESWSLEKYSCQSLDEYDPEIKHEVKVKVTRTCSNSVLIWLEKRISDWTRMKRIIGIFLKNGQILKQKLSPPSNKLTTAHSGIVDIELLEKASFKISKMIQQR